MDLLNKKRGMQEVTSHMAYAREIYRVCGKNTGVCIVIPDGVSIEDLVGEYYPSVASRLDREDVIVVSESELTVAHISDYSRVLDFV